MKKSVIIGIVIAIIIIFAAIYVLTKTERIATQIPYGNDGLSTNASQDFKIIVYIENFAFNPPSANIKSGETLTWENKDSAPHAIISDSNNEINSPTLSNNEQYSHTFNTAGTYEYHCSVHPSMKGKVIVQ
jgi:amicyanin